MLLRPRYWLCSLALIAGSLALAQGRPAELVWGKVLERHTPNFRFADAADWTVATSGDAEGAISVSTQADLWGRPTARIQYKGSGDPFSKPVLVVMPPVPLRIPDGSDKAQLWLHGNRWAHLFPQEYPSVKISLLLQDAAENVIQHPIHEVQWEGWYCAAAKLPLEFRTGASLVGIAIEGGWQTDFRDLYFDSIRFFNDGSGALDFGARPQRNLTPFEGQSTGANLGAIRLEFPTRESTILPLQLGGGYTNAASVRGGAFVFAYDGKDAKIRYAFDPRKALAGLHAWMAAGTAGDPRLAAEKTPDAALIPALPAPSEKSQRATGVSEFAGLAFDMPYVGQLTSGATWKLYNGNARGELTEAFLENNTAVARYADGTELRVKLVQKSLVVDVVNRTGNAAELDFGAIAGLAGAQTIRVPLLTYRGDSPAVAMARQGDQTVFTSLWLDPYRSNATEPYGGAWTQGDLTRINGGVRYHLLSNVTINPMFERLFLTVSPRFEEVLPTVPNPTGLYSARAADWVAFRGRMTQDYAEELSLVARYRNLGLDPVLYVSGPGMWQDTDESTAFRLVGAPGKGGEAGLRDFAQGLKGMGWNSAFWMNVTDASPTSAIWNESDLIHDSRGEWRITDLRRYGIKPLKALEFQQQYATQLKTRYQPGAMYAEKLTSEKPWWLTDMDGRVYGSGSFSQTIYAIGDFLRNQSRLMEAPVIGEGTFQWLYAGLSDGNFLDDAEGDDFLTQPLLPVFALMQIHTKEIGFGGGRIGARLEAAKDNPDELSSVVDQFLATTVAYGNNGVLIPREYGLNLTMRSFYMMQQLQRRYALQAPVRIAYWDGLAERTVSEAVRMGLPARQRQMIVDYANGLRVWVNANPSMGMTGRIGEATLNIAPGGFAAYKKGDFLTVSGAIVTDFEGLGGFTMMGSSRTDYSRSAAYVYLDGRGRLFRAPEGESDGALAIRPIGPIQLELIHGSGTRLGVNRPFKMKGKCTSVEAFSEIGASLGQAQFTDDGKTTIISPVKDAVRYVVTF